MRTRKKGANGPRVTQNVDDCIEIERVQHFTRAREFDT